MRIVLTLEWVNPEDNKVMLGVATVLENMASAKLALLSTKGEKSVISRYEKQSSLDLES